MSSIPDSVLSHPANGFVVVNGNQTLLDAIRMLQKRSGQPDWVLVVDLGKGLFLAARFNDLRSRVQSESQTLLEVPLHEFGAPLTPVEAIDQQTDMEQVQEKIGQHALSLVAVTWAGVLIGVVTAESLREPGEAPVPVAAAAKPAGAKAKRVALPPIVTQVQAEAARLWKASGKHPVMRVIMFILMTALPTFWFWRFSVIPEITPQPVQPMTGEWNVAVAGFTDNNTGAISADDAAQIATVFYNRLNTEMTDLGKESDLVVQVWGPKETGTVNGNTPEERAVDAEKLAKRIKADVVVYGLVRREGDAVQLQPEFYVAIANFYDVEEVVGQHVFGSPISIIGAGQSLPSQLTLNRELTRRAEALSLLTRGLSFYFAHAYENALGFFRRANEDELWQTSPAGREVVDLFIGNAAGRANLLPEAEEAYRDALDVEPEYARAYVGLGGVFYLRSLVGVTSDNFAPDQVMLKQAVDNYEKGLTAKSQPPTADIATKVAFGLAQVYLTRWWAGEDTLNAALTNFQAVLDQYGDGKNPRVQELAAEAHARIGIVHRQQGQADSAIREFEATLKLSTIPARRGLYWATVAGLYAQQGKSADAEKASRNAIAEYKTAIPLTSQPAQQASYWAAIAQRHEELNEIDQARDAWRQAIDLLPAGDARRAEYESQLAQVEP